MSRIAAYLLSAVVLASLCREVRGDDIFVAPGEEDIVLLIECLDDPDVRQGASRALVSIGQPATQALTNALIADSVDVRIWAAYTLGQIGSPASAASGKLVEQLKAEERDLRAVSARALGQMRVANGPVIAGLTKRLSDSEPRVRRWSAKALGQIGPLAKSAVPDLVQSLRDAPNRKTSIEALVAIAEPAVPDLIKALADDALRLDASEALRRIDMDQARPAGVDRPTSADLTTLSLAVRDPARDVASRVVAVRLLGQLGTDAVPILISLFSDKSTRISRAASAAFRRIGSEAVPFLKEAMQDESPRVRAASADAVGAIGPDGADAVDGLIEMLQDSDRTVQHRAVVAIGALGSAGEPAVPALIETVQNPRVLEATRQLAVKTLGRTGPDVHDLVIAGLEQATNDDNYGVRSLATLVLKQLRAQTETE